MSTTISALIQDAFTIIGVVADGRAPTPTQASIGLTTLNDNLMTQQRDGWNLGWFIQTNPANIAPLQDTDIGDVKLCLASWLAPRYGVVIPPSPDPNDPLSLSNQIRNAFTRLNKRSLKYTECDLGELSRPQGGPWGGPNWL